MAKGIKTVEIDGDDVELRLDMNALCDFTDEHDINFDEWDEHLNDPRKMRSLIHCMAKQSDDSIKERDVGKLTFSQMQEVVDMINDAAPDTDKMPSGNETGKSKKK